MQQVHPYLKKLSEPAILFETDTFLIKFAATDQELEQVFKLRYDVFNIEQGKGLNIAEESGLDKDNFDPYCLHLIVLYKPENRVIGTYRVHPGPVAIESPKGFYSATEFKIEGIEKIADRLMEAGRSCVHPEFRSGAVVSLLWSGLAEMLARCGLFYMMGCVSLEVNSPSAAWALLRNFENNDQICPHLKASPMPGYELPPGDPAEIEMILSNRHELARVYPPLLKGYMRLGGKICGEPVYDYEFKTIDFLMLLDTTRMPEKYMKHYIMS